MKHVTVIQHTQSEWLGHIEDHFEGRGIRFGYVRPFNNGGVLPDVDVVGDALVLVGGGTWGTVATGKPLPTLEPEVRLVRACLMLSKPVIAMDLGAQVLAIAADGGSIPHPLTLTIETARRASENALCGYMPEMFPSVVYMRDRPRPPDYATVLATFESGAPAVFQIGDNAFGFVGNPGVRRAMIEDLIMEGLDGAETPDNPGPVLDQLAELGPRIENALVPIMTGLVKATRLMS